MKRLEPVEAPAAREGAGTGLKITTASLTIPLLDLEHNKNKFQLGSGAMIEEGARVKLRLGSGMAQQHAGLIGVVGVVGAITQGRRWQRLDASNEERQRDRAAHVRFRQPPVVLMAVPLADLEPVDHLDPERAG